MGVVVSMPVVVPMAVIMAMFVRVCVPVVVRIAVHRREPILRTYRTRRALNSQPDIGNYDNTRPRIR